MTDQTSQSSFIPKKPTSGGSVLMRSGGLFPFIANTIFVIALIASVSVFGYAKFLEGQISKMQQDLDTQRVALQPDVINQLARSDQRMVAAGQIIHNHVTVSSFFGLLQSLTLQNLRFTSFAFIPNETKGLSVTMKGQARAYATVALQSKIFSENPTFMNPQFSNLDLDEKGNVVFTFRSGIDPKIISYVGNLSMDTIDTSIPSQSDAPVEQTQIATTSATSTKLKH